MYIYVHKRRRIKIGTNVLTKKNSFFSSCENFFFLVEKPFPLYSNQCLWCGLPLPTQEIDLHMPLSEVNLLLFSGQGRLTEQFLKAHKHVRTGMPYHREVTRSEKSLRMYGPKPLQGGFGL